MNTAVSFWIGFVVLLSLAYTEIHRRIPYGGRSWEWIGAVTAFLSINGLVFFALYSVFVDAEWRHLLHQAVPVDNMERFLLPAFIAAGLFGLQEMPIKGFPARNFNQWVFRFSHWFVRIRTREEDQVKSTMREQLDNATELFQRIRAFMAKCENDWERLDDHWEGIVDSNNRVHVVTDIADKLGQAEDVNAVQKQLNRQVREEVDSFRTKMQEYVTAFIDKNRDNSKAVYTMLTELGIPVGPGYRPRADLCGNALATSLLGGMVLGVVMTNMTNSELHPGLSILLFIFALGFFGWLLTLGVRRSTSPDRFLFPVFCGAAGGLVGHAAFHVAIVAVEGTALPAALAGATEIVAGTVIGAATGGLLHLAKHFIAPRPWGWPGKYGVVAAGTAVTFSALGVALQPVLERPAEEIPPAVMFAVIGLIVGPVVARSTEVFAPRDEPQAEPRPAG